MTQTLAERLNQVLPRITNPDFLSSEGIGNEIACYIFDYPAERELQVRESLELMKGRLASHHANLRVLHLNLLEVVVDYLEQRKLLSKVMEMQSSKGDAEVLRAIKGPVAAEKIRDFIAAKHKPADQGLVLVSGVGSAWPVLRAHNLLNCLHPVMGKTPLVMFYPGSYDGTTLRLFGRIVTTPSKVGQKPYYRAFSLVPSEKKA